jgi:hypothetical protein
MALPPVDAGATQTTTIDSVPPVAVTPVGAPGTVAAARVVAVAVAVAEVPVAFTAWTDTV